MTLGLFSAVDDAIAGAIAAEQLSDGDLIAACERINAAYRSGKPLMSDARYDVEFYAELAKRMPEHPFVNAPEPEPADAFMGSRYRHTVAMLSTDKAYNDKAILAWTKRARTVAGEIGLDSEALRIGVTPKLDGIAGMKYPNALVTRGDDGFGTDVSHVIKLGVSGVDREGPGELVVVQKYFDDVLAPDWGLAHPRNAVAGLMGADEIKPYHQQGLEAGMFRFVPYSTLAVINLSISEFEATWSSMIARTAEGCPYLCDGAVAEFLDPDLRAALGSNSKFHRYMIAIKENTEFADTPITEVKLATGRTGRLTQAISVEPVKMYGVTIRSATAHTARHLDALGIGVGAVVRLTRFGSVIPGIVEVLKRADTPVDVSRCPSCGSETEVEGEGGAHRVCRNTSLCPAQASRSLEHFFRTLGVCNGFGPSVTEKLCEGGVTRPSQVYALAKEGYAQCGITPGIAKNLIDQLERSKKEPIDERVWLAAFGIRHLGRGDSGALLKAFPLSSLGDLTAEQIKGVPGFGPITSPAIATSLAAMWGEISGVLNLGFNLIPEVSAAEATGVLAGKTLVFTGTMASGSRGEVEKHAKSLGATIGGSVGKTTTWLVCGSDVGQSKIDKAAKFKVRVVQEAQYLQEINAAVG